MENYFTTIRAGSNELAGIAEERAEQEAIIAQQGKGYCVNSIPDIELKGLGGEEVDWDEVSSVESNEECRFCREWRDAQECTSARPCPTCRETPDVESSLEQHAFHKLLEGYDYEHTPYSKDLDTIQRYFNITASPENLWRYDGRGLRDHILYEDKANRGSYWVSNTRFEFAHRVSEDLHGLLEYLKNPSIGILEEIIPDWVLEVEEDRKEFGDLVSTPPIPASS